MESKAIHLNIALNSKQLIDFENNPENILEYLSTDSIKTLKEFIFDNLQDKDGAPEAGDFKISNIKYQKEDNNGSFRLHFQINRRFCCADTENCNQDYMDFKFELHDSELQLEGIFFDWFAD